MNKNYLSLGKLPPHQGNYKKVSINVLNLTKLETRTFEALIEIVGVNKSSTVEVLDKEDYENKLTDFSEKASSSSKPETISFLPKFV